MASETFFDQYGKELMEDAADFVEWANDYQHYMGIRLEIERQLKHVA